MQYNWYKKELKQRLKALEMKKNDATGNELELINKTIECIETLIEPPIPIYPKDFDLATALEQDYLKLNPSQILWKHIEGVSRLPQYELPYQKTPILNLKKKEILELIHDFFKNATDSKTYQTFLFFWNQRRKNLHFITDAPESVYAESAYLPFTKESFVEINLKNEFADFPTLSHEYGHLIQFYYNYHANIFNSHFAFSEIISTFFELISAEYFAKKEFQIAGVLRQKEYAFDIIDFALFLNKELNILNGLRIEQHQNKNDLRRNIQEAIKNTKVKDSAYIIKDYFPANDYQYLIAYFYATNLFMIYLNDPDKAFYILYQVIGLSFELSIEDYAKRLEILGIADINATASYNEYIKRKLIK